jgi:DNA repair exonuclease SbcCD nuclease subunit
MKIVHVADTHLGRGAFQKTTEDGSNLRETLIYENFLDGIEHIVTEVQPDVLVHSGDLFDTVKPKTKAILVALKALDILEENHIPVVIVAGNHEMQKNAYTASAFEILEKAHPEINAAYSFRYENFFIKGTLFHCIPNMLHAADYRPASEEALSWVRNSTYAGLQVQGHILVTHGLASTIRDKRLATCAEFELTPEILSEQFDYIALGHYHGQMQVGPNAWYSGSQEHLTYGEIKDRKGALEVNIDEKGVRVSRLSLAQSTMWDLGTINCADLDINEVINYLEKVFQTTDICGNDMYQVTLDFGTNPVKSLPAGALKSIRDSVLDLKIRVRSEEIERQQIQQQDLHAIDYVKEFGTFLQQQKIPEGLRARVQEKGTATLQAVMANHAEVTE